MRGRERERETKINENVVHVTLNCRLNFSSSSSAFLSYQTNMFCCFRNYIYVTTHGFAINFQEKHKQIYAVFYVPPQLLFFFSVLKIFYSHFQIIFHLLLLDLKISNEKFRKKKSKLRYQVIE